MYEWILTAKIQKIIEATLSEKQHTFYWERWTTDLTFTMRQLIEKYCEFSKDIVIVFIDFEKSYISMNRENMLW